MNGHVSDNTAALLGPALSGALAAFACMLIALPPAAADQLAIGQDLAGRLCAACHMNPGQGEKSGPSGIPSFSAIARRPGQTHEQIVQWLRSAPEAMPDHKLTWREADTLALFIMSLRKAE